MSASALLLVVGLAALSTPQQDPSSASVGAVVTGVVRGAGGGGALRFAMIEVRSDDRTRTVLADSTGRYRVPNVSRGLQRLRALHVGYHPADVDVLVPGSGTVEVDLELAPRPVELTGLVVQADPLRIPSAGSRGTAASERERALVTLRALEASPGLAEAGLGEAARGQPGNEPGDPTDVLLMRGSTQDLKLVLLDGAPVYTPFHLGGLIQSFDAGALGGAEHHVGGAPARYDGGLSYILDLHTRAPSRDRFRMSGAADLLSVQGTAEGPVGERAGVLLSSRALHGLGGRLAGGEGSPYGYADGLLRADVDAGGAGIFTVTGFANRESVFLDLPGVAGSGGAAIEGASWGNGVLSAAWRGSAGGLALDVGVAASRYRAELPARRWVLNQAAAGWEETVLLASGRTDRRRVTVDALRPGADGSIRGGFSFDHMGVSYGSEPLTPGASAGGDREGDGSVAGVYVDGLQRIGSGLDLRYGARVDHFDPGGARAALRLALMWSLSPTAILTLAGGRYHQLARLADTEAELAVGDGAQVGAGYSGVPGGASGARPLLTVASSDHLVVSLDQDLTDRVRLGLEGFVKSFSGLGDGRDDLASSGVDLRVVRESERATGWLGYSLSWFWQTDAADGRSEFGGRHLLSAGFRGTVAGPAGIDLRVSFSDGLPFTAIPFASRTLAEPAEQFDSESPTTSIPPGGLDDGFLRLDAEVHADFDTRWGGFPVHLRPYLRVLNALDRRDALFYYFEPWRNDSIRPLAELSVLPVLGLEWRF